ncbi:MAG: ABC transporter ATP-binding protein [Bacillota bacterium]|uniref:ATP-binding cassette domain-containing protein n=1 Tax=Thermanaerosceptrum fracticalcis TaxID=1712410 RepID=A0A7G6E2W1_THEFR|nr:ABC transporter ATP-binding protein [Thermanaerosceptrum fracticalcis]QNB46415.1 ATP-binding cassette domain-containing protein [Thermanaerosceptrum fracticalcis]
MTVLEIRNLTKRFGGIVACSDLSFQVVQGEIMGVIGPNGAGKTTVFNLITGVYGPTSGQIIFRGQEIGGKRPDTIVETGIARTFQNIRLFKNLSVLENVIIALDQKHVEYSLPRALLRTPAVSRSEEKLRKLALDYLGIVGLEDKAYQRADSLPYGLQRKLEISRALALEPTLLLLDEPAAGMNPEESLELAGLIREIKNRFSLTILLIEHHMDVVMELCNRIVVMNFGEKLAEGTPEEIQENPLVLKAYLGEGYKRA